MSRSNLQMEQNLKHQKAVNRRTALRIDASAFPVFKSINLVGGPEVKLINISRRGALIKSPEYIAPGSRISLQLVTAEAADTIKGRIIRCRKASMNENVSQYESVIAFTEECTFHLQVLRKTSRSRT